jgi:hypothetical protein
MSADAAAMREALFISPLAKTKQKTPGFTSGRF